MNTLFSNENIDKELKNLIDEFNIQAEQLTREQLVTLFKQVLPDILKITYQADGSNRLVYVPHEQTMHLKEGLKWAIQLADDIDHLNPDCLSLGAGMMLHLKSLATKVLKHKTQNT